MTYIAGSHAPRGCLFCRAGRRGSDRTHLVLARRPNAFLMLNRFPYNPGHLMVAVVRHAARFERLRAAERADLLDLVALAERALAAEYRPDGVNYGANVGRVQGQDFRGTCIFIWSPGGTATRTSCRCSARPRCCRNR
jgi:ATP adenylyltransferase